MKTKVTEAIEREIAESVPLTSEEYRDVLTRIARLAAAEASEIAVPNMLAADGRRNQIVAAVMGDDNG